MTPPLLKVGSREFGFYLLAGNGREEFGINRVRFGYEDATNFLPPDLKDYVDMESANLQKRALKGEIYNGIGYRLNEFGEENGNWKLILSPVDYFTFMLTNMKAGEPILNRGNERVSIMEKYPRDLRDFRNSILANKMGTGVTVITLDGKVMLGSRTAKAVQNPGTIHCSFGESIELADRTPFATIVRGAKEELEIDVEPEEVKFLAAGITVKNLQPTVFGLVKPPITSRELIRSWGKARDKEEALISFTDFNPLEMSRVMQFHRFAAVAEAMAAFALIHDFGEKEVSRYF